MQCINCAIAHRISEERQWPMGNAAITGTNIAGRSVKVEVTNGVCTTHFVFALPQPKNNIPVLFSAPVNTNEEGSVGVHGDPGGETPYPKISCGC